MKSGIAGFYDLLGLALLKSGKIYTAALKFKQSLETYEAIHGPGKPHPVTASLLPSLELLYVAMGVRTVIQNHKF